MKLLLSFFFLFLLNAHASLSHEYLFDECTTDQYLLDSSRNIDLLNYGNNVSLHNDNRCSYIKTKQNSYLKSAKHTNQLNQKTEASVFIWIKPETLNNEYSNNNIINTFFYFGTDDDISFELGVSQDQKLMVYSERRSILFKDISFSVGQVKSIKLNEWNFVGVIFDHGIYRFVINDSLYEYTPGLIEGFITKLVKNPTAKINIGSNGDSSYFTGGIDNISIYNHALNIQEISDLYSSNISEICECGGNTQIINPVFEYYLDSCDYSTENIVLDTYNNLNGVAYNVLNTDGVVCQSSSFNTNSYIEVKNNFLIQSFDEFTFDFYLKIPKLQTATLFKKQNGDGYHIFIRDNDLIVNLNGFDYVTNFNFQINEWTNIKITFDNNILSIIKNNVEINTFDIIFTTTVKESELFEDDFSSGWNNNKITNEHGLSYLGNFNERKNRQEIFKTFDFGVNNSLKNIIIEFDFYEIDSWDNESFIVYINDKVVSNKNYAHKGHLSGQDNRDGGEPLVNLQSSGTTYFDNDEKHFYRIEAKLNDLGQFKLGFGSGLDQHIEDESFGIDNLVIKTGENWIETYVSDSDLFIGLDLVGEIDEIKYFNKKNINSILDENRACEECPVSSEIKFNIVDADYMDDINGLIHTKRSGEPNNYQLQCIDDGSFVPCTINKIEIIDMDTNLVKFTLHDSLLDIDKTKNIQFSIPFSIKNAAFKITGMTGNGEEFDLSKIFSIKPYTFEGDIQQKLIAEYDYNFSIFAKTKTGEIDYGYNSGNNIIVEKFLNENLDPSLNGELIIQPFQFNNGVANIYFYYTDIGNINLKIYDTDWVNDNDYIEYVFPITMFVDHFKLSGSINLGNANGEFTYYATIENFANIDINFMIQALGSKGGILQNYDKNRYHYNDELLIDFEIEDVIFIENIVDNEFINGIKTYQNYIQYNFNRPINTPLTEKLFDADNLTLDIKLSNDQNISLINESEIHGFTQFYYGRFVGENASTSDESINIYPKILIYLENGNGFQEIFSNWFVNYKDNLNSLEDRKQTISNNYSSSEQNLDNSISYYNGVYTESFNFLNNENKVVYIHYDLPEYFWYNRYNISYDKNKDCSTHNCSIINFQRGVSKIETGNPDGSILNIENIQTEKSGIKLFRN